MRVSHQGFRGGDRTTIELPEVQRLIVKALAEAGKKIIFVNCSGSAIGLLPESQRCAAILQAWYPGEAGGQAVADVLFGDYNPAGRLPVTFYRSDAQLPDYEDYSMKGRTYRFLQEDPLYVFGYGLSYTTFKYGQPVYDAEARSVSVKVKNTGKRAGDEVVQLYVRRLGEQPTAKALRGFQRVSIPAGKTVTVSFDVDEAAVSFFDRKSGDVAALNGEYVLMTGGSSRREDLQSVNINW